ncbi:lysyl-tRNA synthetase [Streptococcus mitis]|uniref:Lysyl-tRNA synthetase n=1 Tax=Streptococcus mitis TaxID=28037 RepID=A0A1X1KKG6_STRMT|nr:lysyl-tRNA synthetase [Streptococcus mitis]
MGKLSTRGLPILFLKISLYSMKIKEQTRKLAAGCSKHCFEVADRTDEVSSKYYFEVADVS